MPAPVSGQELSRQLYEHAVRPALDATFPRAPARRGPLRRELPARFGGHPTAHSVCTVRGYVRDQLAVDLDSELDARDCLTLPEQLLRWPMGGPDRARDLLWDTRRRGLLRPLFD